MTFERELEAACGSPTRRRRWCVVFTEPRLTVERKAGDEPVTDADHAANELIVGRLAEAFPDDVILSEEIPDDGARLRQSRVWMVDPIDGTRDFIAGDDGFAVMIGLCVDGRPQVGALALPLTGVVYAGLAEWRVGGKSCRMAAASALRTSTLAGPPGIRLVASKSHRTRASTPSAARWRSPTRSTSAASASRSAWSPTPAATSTSIPAAAPRCGTPARPRPSCWRPAAASPTCAATRWSTPAPSSTTAAASSPRTARCTTW